jgi:septal ring-binding cell division protein DamX
METTMKLKISLIATFIGFLNACSWDMPNSPTREMVYPIDNPYGYEDNQINQDAQPLPKFVKTAEVPQMQVSAKNMDVDWVRKQNPSQYTIMIASNDKPLAVSQALMEIPKNQRSAALKYERNGQVYYTGVYGNFSDSTQAQEALSTLPENVRREANVVEWSRVQYLNYL